MLQTTVNSIKFAEKSTGLAQLTEKRIRAQWEKFNTSFLISWAEFSEWTRTLTEDDHIAPHTEVYFKEFLDPYDYDCVTSVNFQDLLLAFGPSEQLIKRVDAFCSNPCYVGPVSMDITRQLLYGKPATYLIRQRGTINQMAIHFWTDSGVETIPFNLWHGAPQKVTTNESEDPAWPGCPTWQDLVKSIVAKHTLVPYTYTLKQTSSFYANIDSKTAEKMLVKSTPGTYILHFVDCPARAGEYIQLSFVNKHGKPKSYTVVEVPQKGFCLYPLDKDTIPLVVTEDKPQPQIKEIPISNKRRDASGSPSPPLSTSREIVFTREPSKEALVTSDDTPKPTFFPSLSKLLGSFKELRYGYSDSFSLWPLERFEPWNEDYTDRAKLSAEAASNEGSSHLCAPTMSVCYESIATYPKGSLGAQIMCDAVEVQRVGNRLTVALCDGCAWGTKSRDAAQHGSKTFCNYMSSGVVNQNCTDTLALKGQLRNALEAAHKAILNAGQKKPIGTTTLLGGILLKYAEGPEYSFASICIGDCKAFRWDCSTGKVVDITSGNRLTASDAKDCGGRIGHTSNQQLPDMRNLSYCLTDCHAGDVILLVSDGVYDNLDPERLGKMPFQVDSNFPKTATWNDLTNEVSTLLREAFLTDLIAQLINDTDKSLHEITKKLVNHAWKVTSKSREFMESHPNSNEPSGFLDWPGKMDHTTCLAILVQALGNKKSPHNKPENQTNLKIDEVARSSQYKRTRSRPKKVSTGSLSDGGNKIGLIVRRPTAFINKEQNPIFSPQPLLHPPHPPPVGGFL